MESHPAPGSTVQALPSRPQLVYLALLALGLVGSLVAIFLADWGDPSPNSTDLLVGQVSPITIFATQRVTFASQIETHQAQEKAAASVPDAFTPADENLARQQVRTAQQILAFVDTVREDPFGRRDQQIDWIKAVPSVSLAPVVISQTLGLDSVNYGRVVSETLYVLDVTMREQIRTTEMANLLGKISSRISLTLGEQERTLVAQWVGMFLAPNSFADTRSTEANRARARESVGTVYRTVEKGEAAVRAGEIISPLAFEALQAMGFVRSRNEFGGPLAAFLLASFLCVLSAAYVGRFRAEYFVRFRYALLFGLLLCLTLAGEKLLSVGRNILPYLFPSSAPIMIATVLLGPEVALGLAVVLGLGVGYVFQGSLEFAALTLTSGLLAVVTLRRTDKLTAFLISGITVGLANVIVVLIFRVTATDLDLNTLPPAALAAAGNGVIAGVLALGGLLAIGRIFGITTSLDLIELARPTQELQQRLLREAPGTYHHSLVVSNLAEHAAERIGANSLLVRVGAYYHDIGKVRNPQFYVENQLDGVNPHETLDPRTSAGIVHRHVSDGLALAQRHGLPALVRAFIPAHHGTTLAAFFYRRERERGEGEVLESDYRYPGPKPQSRETAIVMLADGVEAASRSDRPTSAGEIRAIVDRIVQERLMDGQLDEVNLTLREIDQIKQAFFEILQGLFHPRIRYPKAPDAPTKAESTPASQPGRAAHP